MTISGKNKVIDGRNMSQKSWDRVTKSWQSQWIFGTGIVVFRRQLGKLIALLGFMAGLTGYLLYLQNKYF